MRQAVNAAVAAFAILWLGGFTEAANATTTTTPFMGCFWNGLHLQAWVQKHPDFMDQFRLSEGQRRLIEVGCLTVPKKAR